VARVDDAHDWKHATVVFFILLPLVGLGLLYWYGRPKPRKLALALALGLPLLTLVLAGIAPVVRVSQRVDDGNLQARLAQGNGVALVWAPEGPGWPRAGGDWYEARGGCCLRNDLPRAIIGSSDPD
jgi:hypothetical protein